MRLARVAALVVLALTLSSGARIEARADAADDVRAADSLVYQAIAARDAGKLGDLLDDGFLLTNTFGEVYDKARFLQACCAGESTSRNVLLGAIDAQVKVYGNAAVIVARTEMRFTRDTEEQKLAWRSTRTFVKSGGKWKLAAEQRTSVG